MNTSGLAAALEEKKDKINDSLSWKELDDPQKIERLRTFVKKSIQKLDQNYQFQISQLQEQIVKLQNHKHDEEGMPFIPKRLNEENGSRYDNEQPAIPTPRSLYNPNIATGFPGLGNLQEETKDYI